MKKDFLEVIRSRKSIRSFLPDPVPRSIIEEIIAIAVEAPTSCNQQLWNFVVVDDPAVKERLVAEAAGNTLFRRVPILVAVTYDGWNRKEALQGASLAVGHLLLAAAYHGIGASPINSYGADSKVKKVLGIPESEMLCCFVILGYPDNRAQAAPPVPRKEVKEVIHWNAFEKKLRAPYTYDPDDWSLAKLALHQRHYCRKTFLGKKMDLSSSLEQALVKKILAGKEGPFLDLFSYDGGYLSEFPQGDIDTLDTTPEVAAYTEHAGVLAKRPVHAAHVYDEQASILPGKPHTMTLIYKAERLPHAVLKRLFTQAYATLPSGGEMIIIARRRPSLFSAFLALLRLVFGNDVRKTGLYAFFGPYRPIHVSALARLVKDAGFERVQWNGYFAFPSFFEQLYQMVVQYKRSGGSSYLHRDRKVDIVSKTIDAALSAQGFVRCGVLGSVAVISCKKS